MRKTTYTIALRTPIGIRNGTMDIQIRGKRISGMLHILNRSEPFGGHMEDAEKCSLTGKLVTLMRTIPYRAAGRITKETIDLSLIGGKESFRLTGESSE